MSLMNWPTLLLDSTEYKMHVAKILLTRYQADFNRCQLFLTKEVMLRNHLEQYCRQLHHHIVQLETELTNYRVRDNEMQAMFGEAKQIHNVMKQNNHIQSERIELLTYELSKMNYKAAEANRTAQLNQQRAEQMCHMLRQSELQLEISRNKQIALQSELASAAQNLHNVKCVAEHSSQKLLLVDHEMLTMKQRLEETERRAQLAELAAQELKLSSIQLEQRMEKQLEERWQQKLQNLEKYFLARDHQ